MFPLLLRHSGGGQQLFLVAKFLIYFLETGADFLFFLRPLLFLPSFLLLLFLLLVALVLQMFLQLMNGVDNTFKLSPEPQNSVSHCGDVSNLADCTLQVSTHVLLLLKKPLLLLVEEFGVAVHGVDEVFGSR